MLQQHLVVTKFFPGLVRKESEEKIKKNPSLFEMFPFFSKNKIESFKHWIHRLRSLTT